MTLNISTEIRTFKIFLNVFSQMKVMENFKWKQLKYGVTKTSFMYCSPNTALHNVTGPCLYLLSNDFLSICSVKHLYRSQNVNAALCHDFVYTQGNSLHWELCYCPQSLKQLSLHLLLLLDESHQLHWQRNFCKSISDMEREMDNMVGSEHLRSLA